MDLVILISLGGKWPEHIDNANHHICLVIVELFCLIEVFSNNDWRDQSWQVGFVKQETSHSL